MRNPYPNFTWFVGVAEDINDPKQLGRVRARAVGFHPSIEIMNTDQLPFAQVLNGGTAKINVGEMVMGFFMDGEEAQQPVILGTLGGAVSSATGENRASGSYDGVNKSAVSSAANGGAGEMDEEGVPNYEVGPTSDRVTELQSRVASTRKLPLSSRLKSVLISAAESANLYVVVTSGGQPAAPGGPRVGSVRHDNGNAADFDLYYPDSTGKAKGSQILTSNNLRDLENIKKFLKAARSAGAKGIGHGPGYMGSTRFHVDVVNPALVWGAAGKTANAPIWLKNL